MRYTSFKRTLLSMLQVTPFADDGWFSGNGIGVSIQINLFHFLKDQQFATKYHDG